MELHLVVEFTVGSLAGEVEDQAAAGEVEGVAVVEAVEQGVSRRPGGVPHGPVACRPLQIEAEQGSESQVLDRSVHPIRGGVGRIKGLGEDGLAPSELLGHLGFEALVGTDVVERGVALDLDEAAGDGPGPRVEVEQGKVAALEGEGVAEFPRLAAGFGVQLGVGVQRDDDLVVQCALVVQVEAGQGQAEYFRALGGGGGGQLEGEVAGEQAQLLEEGVEVTLFDVEPVLLGSRPEQGAQFVDRIRADHDLVAEATVQRGRVVDDVLGSVALSGVVEVLQAEGLVDGDDPVADLVRLVEQGPVGGVEGKDGARHVAWCLSRGGNVGRGAGEESGQPAQESGKVLRVLGGQGDAVAWHGPPHDLLLAFLVRGGRRLYQAVHRGVLDVVAGDGAVLFPAEGINEHGQMCVELGSGFPEFLHRADGVDELRTPSAFRGVQERLRLGGGKLTLCADQFTQRRTGLGGFRIGHAQANVIGEVPGVGAALQFEEGVGDDLSSACVDDVHDQGADVRVEVYVPLDPVGEGRAGQRTGSARSPGAGGGEVQRRGEPAEQATGVGGFAGQVGGPVGGEVVRSGHEPTVLARDGERETQR
ncbi:hypothetical protein P376_0218 [Streptomyces sp. HCCB10043]|nr:hypothetical protein P376_0218 [Streptomyces sp. HCCB10043]